MVQQLVELLETVEVTEPQAAGGLQVFGLRRAGGSSLNYTTLDDALAAQTLEVTEVSEGGSVPVLKVVNKNDLRVFLMAGEQLVGAKQNRVLNTSIMVPAQSELAIPVSCVEAGRWAYRSRRFASPGTSAHSLLRYQMAKQVHESYRRTGAAASQQVEVWNEIERKLAKMGSASPSRELQQAYADYDGRLSFILGELGLPEGCCGAVFAFGGRIVGADLFDQPATFARLWPKLVRAFAIDALEEPETPTAVPREEVERWLRSAGQARVEPFQSPGLGEDVRLAGAGLVGCGLIVEDQPVHVELFAEEATAA